MTREKMQCIICGYKNVLGEKTKEIGNSKRFKNVARVSHLSMHQSGLFKEGWNQEP